MQAEEIKHIKAVLQRKSRVCVRGTSSALRSGGKRGCSEIPDGGCEEEDDGNGSESKCSSNSALSKLGFSYQLQFFQMCVHHSEPLCVCVSVYEAVCSGGKGQLWRCFTPAGTPAALAPPCGTLYCAFEDTASHTS